MTTDLLYLTDAYRRAFESTVAAQRDEAVALEHTCFYPTGGGQPHDTGVLITEGGRLRVTAVRKDGDVVWHQVEGPLPATGSPLRGEIDWPRRYALMRTHTALHILCGVIWHRWGKAVTGGNMAVPEQGSVPTARMDFEFDPLPSGFGPAVEQLVNDEIAQDRPVEISFLPRDTALADEDLLRTKVNLIPESVREIRVVDIVGLDKQADGGTHVARTGEIGRVAVVKTESKGKGNKRIRIEVHDG